MTMRKSMKAFLALLLLMFSLGSALQAREDAANEAFARQLIILVKAATTDYRELRGPLAGENKITALFTAAPVSRDLKSGKQWVLAQKNGTRAYFYADYTGDAAISFVESSFLGLATLFAGPDRGRYEGYTVDPALRKQNGGGFMGFLFYRGITVAKLSIPEKRDEATLFIGLLFSENLTADLAVLAPAAAPEARKTWGSPLADALIKLRDSANRNYDGLVGEKKKRADGVPFYAAPPLLGADECEFYRNDRFGLTLVLTYLRTNSAARKTEKEVQALFGELVRSGRFRWGYVSDTMATIMEGDRDILNYRRVSEGFPGYLEISIYQSLPMAAESAYGGKFPNELASGDAPQIWEIRGKGRTADSYLRCNGVFRDGMLLKGYKTYHGYGEFLDGIWFSDEWLPTYGSYDVVFHPAFSTDTILGRFRDDGDMTSFSPDSRYEVKGDSSTFRADAPGWLLTTFADYQRRSIAARREWQDTYSQGNPAIPYKDGPQITETVYAPIFTALDGLLTEGVRDFAGMTFGARPSYATNDNQFEAADVFGADHHYLSRDSNFSPSYVAHWHRDNPRAETLRLSLLAYFRKLQVQGTAKVSSRTKDTIRPNTKGASAWLNGVQLTFEYNESGNGELLTVIVGRHQDYRAGHFANAAGGAAARRNAPGPDKIIPQGTHACIPCGGRGRVIAADRYGNRTSEFCPACKGQGTVSN
jgi:hypothetical protein